ncbi:MAG: transglycosylase SLT domain-containing protein [Chitinivibrionales bacterium]|nr:transglycosylase SLT domain-containing protein [Chitinivibrionales bacterium]
MPEQKNHHRVRIIRFRKNHIWFSEIVGIIIIVLIVSAIITMGSIIISNEKKIRSNNAILATTKQHRIVQSYEIQILRQKHQLAFVLDTFTRHKLKQKTLWTLVDIVYTNSETIGYDPLLVLAVINVESLFDPKAKGQYQSGELSGAFGLMQLKVETAHEMAHMLKIPFSGEHDLYNPEINIALGIAYLTKQITRFKSLKLGILSYNQGPGVIRNNLKNNIPLSIQYYNKVLINYYNLKKMSDRINGFPIDGHTSR